MLAFSFYLLIVIAIRKTPVNKLVTTHNSHHFNANSVRLIYLTHVTEALNLWQHVLPPHLTAFSILSPPQDTEKDLCVVTITLAASSTLTVDHQVKTLYGRDGRGGTKRDIIFRSLLICWLKYPFRIKASIPERSAATALTVAVLLRPRSSPLYQPSSPNLRVWHSSAFTLNFETSSDSKLEFQS